MKRIGLFFILFSFFSCQKPAATGEKIPTPPSPNAYQFSEIKRPKNIVLLIGDGMGLCHLTASYYENGNKLNIERFPITGVQKTHSKDDLITDSAASATAMACGVKTNNGFLGVFPNGKPAATILELAEQKGLATGLVATSSITHATPAAFIAHINDRAKMDDIALDFLKTDIDLFIGGGENHFDARKTDARNLTNELSQKGYQILRLPNSDLKTLTPDFSKPLAFFTDKDEPKAVTEGRDYLPAAASFSLNFLKKRGAEKGFFCMMEGSQIDWAAHDNDLPRTMAETIDFDRAIGNVLDWARADGETLVIVTADHETGGLSINQQSKMGKPLKVSWSTSGHTAVMVPVFAAGPGAELFGGMYDNTAIFEKMRLLLSL